MGLSLDVVICLSTCGVRKLAVFGLMIFTFETSENFSVHLLPVSGAPVLEPLWFLSLPVSGTPVLEPLWFLSLPVSGTPVLEPLWFPSLASIL